MTKMMFLKVFTVIYALGMFSCTGSVEEKIIEIPVYDNAVNLELRFGDDDEALGEKFIIAKPREIGVSNANEILVLDESVIKVYDQDGNGLKVVGTPGQGPNEFEQAYRMHVGPSGFVTIKNYMAISLLNPELEILNKRLYGSSEYLRELKKDRGWLTMMVLYVRNFDEKNRVILAEGYKMSEEEGSSLSEDFQVLIHENGDVLTPITEYTQGYNNTIIMNSGSSMFSTGYHFEFFGNFLWTALPGNKVVFIDTGKDYTKSEGLGIYRLTILSLDDGSKTTLEQPYDLIPINEEKLPNKSPGRLANVNGFNAATYDQFVDGAYALKDKLVHNAPLQAIITDGDYLFAFTYKTNSEEEIFTHVFDMRTMKHISSTYFSKVPRTISNGKAYMIEREDEDSFYNITKYSIDPKVYGRTVEY